MTTTPTPHRLLCLALLAFFAFTTGVFADQAGSSPVKIFILAGQSNMEGQGNISPVTTPGTLEHVVANDPGGDYQFLVDGGGAWVVRDDVWIRDESPAQGGLTVGYGSNSGTVGPELGFGHFIGDLNEQQVLIVKAAWGGKSLAVDFRPPSSGGTTGFYYNEVLRLVNEATTNLGTYFPDYDGGGYEIAGFGWHQGWNDRVDQGRSAQYETNMANFIRDMRSALGESALPFVIATTGMDGTSSYTQVEQAQLAMTNTTTYPDFAGSVAVIDTRSTYEGLEFWQPSHLSPADEGYHWNRNAKTYTNIGLAMGDAMSIMAPGRCPFRLRATGGPGGVTLTWQNGTEIPTSVRVLRDGNEIAAAASASPATFLDTTAEPGVLDYELIFTMPGDACDSLTVSFDAGITGLEASRRAGGIDLSWTNNLGYSAIEIRRDGAVIEPALSGSATTYTDASPPASGLVTYSAVPTNGSSAPAEVQINLDSPLPYDPFDYELNPDNSEPSIAGKDGGTGWTAPWANQWPEVKVFDEGLSWGSLETSGRRVRAMGHSAIYRPIGTTLADAGLLNDGATVWMSFIADFQNQGIISNLEFHVALATDSFLAGWGDDGNGNERYSRMNHLLNYGEGIGISAEPTWGGSDWVAQFRTSFWQDNGENDNDAGDGPDGYGNLHVSAQNASSGITQETALVVAKIDWGANASAGETITLYLPGEDFWTPGGGYDLGPAVQTETTEPLDQSQFDTVSIMWKDQPGLDEIRIGATMADVLPVPVEVRPEITAITALGGGTWELTLLGEPDTAYEFRSSPTLEFNPGTLVENLTQGDPNDPGTVGGANGSVLTTNDQGDGTVRMALTGPANFVVAEGPSP